MTIVQNMTSCIKLKLFAKLVTQFLNLSNNYFSLNSKIPFVNYYILKIFNQKSHVFFFGKNEDDKDFDTYWRNLTQ